MRRALAICLALGLGVAAVYGQTLGFDFVRFDDDVFVTRNPQVQQGLSLEGVAWALGGSQTGHWHPLTWLSHMLDVELFGTYAGGHHATSVLLHALNALLLFGLLRSATGALWRSALVAGLFALHPLHVESVAWIAERRDVLSTAFGLLAIWIHLAATGWARSLGVLLCFGLGLAAKPMLVTLPCVLLLLDWWPLRRSRPARLVLEKLPLFGLALAVTLVTFVLQERVGAVATLQGLPLELRAANALVSYAGYLGQLFWPRDLGLFYPHPYIEDSGGTPPAPWQIAGAAVLLLGLTGLALRARGRPYLAVGWLWYLCTLAPVIGIVQVGMQAAADRYMYLPSIGLLVAIVWGAADLFARLRPRLPWPEGLAAAAAATALLALAAGAWQQTRHWRDSLSLFERTLEVSPRNPTIRFNLANHLRDLGRLDDAIREYETALGETRHSADIHVNLANVLRSQGRLDEAAFHYRRTLAIDPEHPLANNGLATVLRAQGNLDEAEAHYRRALRASPGSIAGYNLGNLLRARGRLAEALAVYREALQERPRDARLHNNLAAALDEAGDAEAALRHYAEAVRLAPDYAFAHRNLGALRERRGELEAAIAHFRRAHELAPDDPLARQSLEQALARREAQPR